MDLTHSFTVQAPIAETWQAFQDIESLCTSLVQSGRWTEMTAARLLKDMRECGPAAVPERQAA